MPAAAAHLIDVRDRRAGVGLHANGRREGEIRVRPGRPLPEVPLRRGPPAPEGLVRADGAHRRLRRAGRADGGRRRDRRDLIEVDGRAPVGVRDLDLGRAEGGRRVDEGAVAELTARVVSGTSPSTTRSRRCGPARRVLVGEDLRDRVERRARGVDHDLVGVAGVEHDRAVGAQVVVAEHRGRAVRRTGVEHVERDLTGVETSGPESTGLVSGTLVSGTFVSGTLVSGTLVSGTLVSGTLVSGTLVSGWLVSGRFVSAAVESGTATSAGAARSMPASSGASRRRRARLCRWRSRGGARVRVLDEAPSVEVEERIVGGVRDAGDERRCRQRDRDEETGGRLLVHLRRMSRG